jgi:glycerophosphoryl diester phosphodiesterase
MPQRQPADVLRIAHRGADAAEKYDPASLAEVAQHGAHLVEFDIHVTGDDRLVVRHDPTVTINGRKVWLADHALADHEHALRQQGVPIIDDVVHAAQDAGLGLYVDVKSLTARAARRLVDTLRAAEMLDSTILASPRSDLVALCAEVAPHVPRAVLFPSTLEEPVQLARAVSAHFVHPCWEAQPRPDHILASEWLDRIRSHQLGVICWHEERPNVLEGLYTLGVDGICTDTPSLLTNISTNQSRKTKRDSDSGA